MVITALSVGKIKHTLVYKFVLEYPCIFLAGAYVETVRCRQEYLSQKQEGPPP